MIRYKFKLSVVGFVKKNSGELLEWMSDKNESGALKELDKDTSMDTCRPSVAMTTSISSSSSRVAVAPIITGCRRGLSAS